MDAILVPTKPHVQYVKLAFTGTLLYQLTNIQSVQLDVYTAISSNAKGVHLVITFKMGIVTSAIYHV